MYQEFSGLNVWMIHDAVCLSLYIWVYTDICYIPNQLNMYTINASYDISITGTYLTQIFCLWFAKCCPPA
jgi:hypothetical protein